MADSVLSTAVIAYVGQAGRLDDVAPEQRVIDRIGEAAAHARLGQVRTILDELYSAEPLRSHAVESDLGQRASAWLHTHYPHLSDDAVSAIASNFQYDWR